MKKKMIICFFSIFVVAIILIIVLFTNKSKETFYLENKYYGTNNITEINIEKLNNLINEKESFVVFVYQPMCITSSDFEEVLNDFFEDNPINIYKIAFSDIKDVDVGANIKYYPSFIIYNKGKVVDYLEANKDEDVEFYTSKESFGKWFTKYVRLNSSSSNKNEISNNEDIQKENNILEDVNLENVVREDNKVNIYFFWGNGCPHCAEEFEFFESIKEEYGDYYNLYTFEVWYNEENAKILSTFANNMGDNVTGVPYTIIGNKSFIGFGQKYKNDFINTIEKQHENGYDVYFDKIKK